MTTPRRTTTAAAVTVALLAALPSAAIAGASTPGISSVGGHLRARAGNGSPATAAVTAADGAKAAPMCSADFYSIYADGQNGEEGDQGFPDPLVFDTADRLFIEYLYGTGASGGDTFTSATDTVPGTSVPGTGERRVLRVGPGGVRG